MPKPTSSPSRIVILGGGYAGLTVAQRLSQQKTGAQITLVDTKPAFEQRIRLHQIAAGQAPTSFSYPSFLDALGVSFIQGRVTAIEAGANRVIVAETAGAAVSLEYDYLVYALGSFMDATTVPGVREHAHAFDSVATAKSLHARLRQSPEAKVLVVGGGITGIETATELAESLPALRVTLAMAEPLRAQAVAGGFAEAAAQYLNQALAKRQIEVLTGARISQLSAGSAAQSDGKQVAFDVCVWTCGFKPSPLAAQAGLQVNGRGQIEVDASLRSLSHPNIIVVGDAASVGTEAAGACRMGSATALAMGPSGARTLLALLENQTPPAFRFVYLFRNICLGRDDGVVQFVDRRDHPREIVWTGATAAAWKEYVCQGTLSIIGLAAAERPPVLPPLRTLPQLIQGMRQYA